MPPHAPCWKCPKRFKLSLGEVWENECSSNSDVDKAAFMNQKLSPPQSSVLNKNT